MIVLGLIIISLSSLLKQRISVPELRKEKWKNYLIIISFITSLLSVFSLLFYNQRTLSLSRIYFKSIDNVFFACFMITTYIYCHMTYMLLSKLNIKEIPKDCNCLYVKKALLVYMSIQILCCKYTILTLFIRFPKYIPNKHIQASY